jgi:hypothetical protein
VPHTWKALDEGYNFASTFTSIRGLHKKLWASKVTKVLILKISGLPIWESRVKMTFGCRPTWPGIENTIRGKVVVSPNPSRGESCEFVFARGLSVHQMCSNYALTNLLFGLCRFMWIIDLLIAHPSPHPEALARPSTLKVLRTKECTPTFYPSTIFTFGLTIESIKEFEGASIVKHLQDFGHHFHKRGWTKVCPFIWHVSLTQIAYL